MKLIFSVYDDVTIWPQFRAHYEANGVTEFICVSYLPSFQPERVHLLDSSHLRSQFSGRLDAQLHNAARTQFVSSDEWFVIADLDEFSEATEPLANLAYQAQKAGCNTVYGHFIDRVASDWSLPAEIGDDVFNCFPLSTGITSLIGAETQKLVMLRGDVEILPGHHNARHISLRRYEEAVKVNHFKYWGDLHRRTYEWMIHYNNRSKIVAFEKFKLLLVLEHYFGISNAPILSLPPSNTRSLMADLKLDRMMADGSLT